MLQAPAIKMEALGDHLGFELIVQRDDLLPFPLAGNKVRKVSAEIAELNQQVDLLITNGAVDSNHCRTVAMMGRDQGYAVHLVLHGDATVSSSSSKALTMLRMLGATFEIVPPGDIRERIVIAEHQATQAGQHPHVIAGGCHTKAGAISYRNAAIDVLSKVKPDIVFVPSGTGATHGGLATGATLSGTSTRVIGISVARQEERGKVAVQEAAAWAGAPNVEIEFDDSYIDGGYQRFNKSTIAALELGWNYGLPLDPTYTAKAFAGMLDYARGGKLKDARVLFWHTGGLWNFVSADIGLIRGNSSRQSNLSSEVPNHFRKFGR